MPTTRHSGAKCPTGQAGKADAGDIVTVALQGHLGKPRSAVILQLDRFSYLSSVTVLPFTSRLIEATLLRIDVLPSLANDLLRPSQIMVDKPQTPSRDKLGSIERLDDEVMATVTRAVAIFFGIV